MVRLIKVFATPAVWVLVLMVAGLWWSRRLRRRKGVRVGWYAMLVGMVLYVLLTSRLVAGLLCYSLEHRCPPVSDEELKNLDVMVVLSGGALPPWEYRPMAEPGWATRSRVSGAAQAFERSGAEVFVVSGGKTVETDPSAAETMRDFAVRLGVPAEKIVMQAQSRTTAEDASETLKVLGSGSGRRIGVVTSAIHIRRSRRIFEKAFTEDVIVAVPVDYLYVPPRWEAWEFLPSADAFYLNSMVIHEYVGGLWYRLRRGM